MPRPYQLPERTTRMTKEEILRQINEHKLVAVVRTKTPEQALATAKALIQAGVRLIEITLTIPEAIEVIRHLARGQEGAVIGAGTVITLEQAKEAVQAGARFLVSPVNQTELVPICQEAGVVSVVGGFSPTEILRASQAGADLVKVFPIGSLGGPTFIKELLGPLPDLPLMVSGGVNYDNFLDYLRLGVRTVALGGSLMPAKYIEAGDYSALAEHAGRFVAALKLSPHGPNQG